MARVIEAHPEAFNAMVFGTGLHPASVQFLQSAPVIQTSQLTDMGQQFMQYTHNLMNQVLDSNIARTAIAALRTIEHSWGDDIIRELRDIGQLQQAPGAMLRWIMANETVRAMHSRQEISGYDGRWFDPTPQESGREHFEWRCVNNGVLQERIVDGEETFGYTHYLDERDSTSNLSLADKDAITASWAHIEHHLRYGNSDPTSKWNSAL